MGLLTAPTCRSFLSVAHSFVHCMDDLVIYGFFIIVHGQRPWTTSLSSMGDFIIHEPYSCPRTFLNLLGWFLILSALLDMDNPYGWIGDELISRYPIGLDGDGDGFWGLKLSVGFVAEIGRIRKKRLWLFGLTQWVSRRWLLKWRSSDGLGWRD